MPYHPPKINRYQFFAGKAKDAEVKRGAETFIDYASEKEAARIMYREGYDWGQLVEWRYGKPVVVQKWDARIRYWQPTEENVEVR